MTSINGGLVIQKSEGTNPANSLNWFTTMARATRPPKEEPFVCSFYSGDRAPHTDIDNAFWIDGSWTLRKRETVGDAFQLCIRAGYVFPESSRIAGHTEYPTCLYFVCLWVHRVIVVPHVFCRRPKSWTVPFVQLETVLGSGSSHSVLRCLAHLRGWIPASASSIGLPRQVHHRCWIHP